MPFHPTLMKSEEIKAVFLYSEKGKFFIEYLIEKEGGATNST